MQTRQYENGVTADYTYNANNWITQLEHTVGATLIAGFGHDYDKEGNKKFEEKQHNTNLSEAYQYDNSYRLIDYKVGTLSGSTVSVPMTQTAYDLDCLGNWDSKTTDGTTQSRTHNMVNELTAIGGVSLDYDDNGNVIEDERYTYVYDEENRLQRVTRRSDSQIVGIYQYDALGRRVDKQASPTGTVTETLYFYDDARVIEEQSTLAATQAEYIYGNYIDEVLVMSRGGQLYYYHQNALWSVAAITDSLANVVERYTYDAYGCVTITDGANNPVPPNAWNIPHSAIDNPYMFTGRELDEEIGLYYYRARYYDCEKGRFLQRDVLGYVDGMNLYEYTRSNSKNLVDPFGNLSKCCVGLGDFTIKAIKSLTNFFEKLVLPEKWESLILDAGNSAIAACMLIKENPDIRCTKTKWVEGKETKVKGCCCQFDGEANTWIRGPSGKLEFSVSVPQTQIGKVIEVKGDAGFSAVPLLATQEDNCPKKCKDDRRVYLLQFVAKGSLTLTIRIPTQAGAVEIIAVGGAQFGAKEKTCDFICGRAPKTDF
ncbi:RHS repeat domain-containing protein [Desulfobacter postgatei]|uniref:RHS repeat domain-containing protein n=1 Tax=Desulfobacter postgatei TaxID=2293 RepID=UPI000232B8CC|nr:RHS repeat-associated core domain-containing protein [Desulfobacter postgatei]